MQENTTSRMISDIRLPLAVMVVFIHSFGSPTEYDINWSDIGGMDVYNMVRVLCSHVISHIAVPAFYVISGYLFFIKAERLDWSFYKKQWTKRVRTLLVPYILWNVIQALFLLSKMVLGVLINGNPIERLSSFTDGILSPAVLWDYHSWGGGYAQCAPTSSGPQYSPYSYSSVFHSQSYMRCPCRTYFGMAHS